jgi:hypothetical protein
MAFQSYTSAESMLKKAFTILDAVVHDALSVASGGSLKSVIRSNNAGGWAKGDVVHREVVVRASKLPKGLDGSRVAISPTTGVTGHLIVMRNDVEIGRIVIDDSEAFFAMTTDTALKAGDVVSFVAAGDLVFEYVLVGIVAHSPPSEGAV